MSEPVPLPAGGGGGVAMVVFDFDGVFTDNTVWSDAAGNEWVRSWRGDGIGLSALRQLGIPAWVLSTEPNPVVSRRCEKIGVPCRQGLSDKSSELRRLCVDASIALESTAYVGNDVNDAACLELVGYPIVVADAHPAVVGLARFRTETPGGFGAVREICDWISGSRQASMPS
jgi:3-deoxy-D-manno-octulosonate 8-phosphate phosphatase (KDO 8-P phosphatase)